VCGLVTTCDIKIIDLAQEKDVLLFKCTLVQTRRMGGWCEFDQEENTLTLYTPESWSFWMSLKVLVDGINCIWRRGVSGCLAVHHSRKNTVTTHVVHLLRPISFRKGVRDIDMPEEQTKCCCDRNLDAKIDLLGSRCLCSTMDCCLSITCGTITYTTDLLAVVLVRFYGVQPNPKEN
jgi:hypothetical protein